MPFLLRRVALPVAVFLTTLAVVTSWTIPGDDGRFLPALSSLATDGSVALLWWLAAAGFGLWLDPRPREARADADGSRGAMPALAAALPIGAAALLSATHLLGSIGVLTAGAGVVNWVLVASGLFLLVRRGSRWNPREGGRRPASADVARGSWEGVVAPSLAAALVALYAAAAASAPAWLWSSEFSGFDALSYHLELPKAWIASGGVVGPVEGNIYSALPSFVEVAFMQLMLMRGSVVDGAIACQHWATGAALATALAVGELAARVAGDRARWPASLAFLSLPWALVTGTLAYNDLLPCLALAGAWLLIERDDVHPLGARDAAVLALLAAAAVGAKPTAFLFVALPLLGIVVLRRGARVLRLAPLVVAIALAVLSPWLVRNGLAYGNPLFPFAHAVFGSGPWTSEQFAIFAAGHGPDRPFLERIPLLWSQWLAHGTGAPPAQHEPWFPQWGLLPLAGLAGLLLESRHAKAARAGIVAVSVAALCWLLATHLKSRFLLPTAVPLALGVAFLALRAARATQPAVAPLLVGLLLPLPFLVYWREPARTVPADGALLSAPAAFIGGASFMTGEVVAADVARAATAEERALLLARAPTAYFINFALPKEARIVAVGHSTPFYFARAVEWNTVWDRGALDRVADLAPDEPASWGLRLRELGFTHALIQPNMLDRWEQSGWLNPRLAPKAWIPAFLQANRAIPTADGSIIVELAGP